MKKVLFSVLILSLAVGGFISYDLKSNQKVKISRKSQEIKEIKPELLIFHFQPSLKENSEVVINFEKKYLVFKAMFPFIPEPPPPPREDGTVEPFTSSRMPLKAYRADLSEDDLMYFKSLIKSLSTSDYKGIENTYIDGTSYQFSILFSDKGLKNGFIAQDKTENQQKIILEILRLLHKTNPHQDNLEILQYYSRHW